LSAPDGAARNVEKTIAHGNPGKSPAITIRFNLHLLFFRGARFCSLAFFE